MAKRPRPRPKPRPKPRTLNDIKKGVDEAERAKIEVIQTAKEFGSNTQKHKSKLGPFLVGTIVCAGIMALGLLERSRVLMMIGGAGFLSFLGMVLYEWTNN